MYVKCLKMQNFRGISDLTLEFESNKPTVFIGVNGVGKSSILDCLAILFSWLLARIQYEPVDYSSLSSYSRTKRNTKNGLFFTEYDIKNHVSTSICEVEVAIDEDCSVAWLLSISKTSEHQLEKKLRFKLIK